MNRIIGKKARAAWLAALALAAAAPAAAQQPVFPPQDPFLTVNGVGEVRIASDRSRIVFMVETQAPTAQAAATQNADLMDKVMRALRTAGAQTVTIETGGYNLFPVYRQPARDQSGIPVIEAYRAVNQVRVRADDVARVGSLIDAGISAGANRIGSLTFEAKDPQPARLEAYRLAVAKARAEAEAVATAMGVTLSGPLEVNLSADYGNPMPMYREMAMDMAAQAAPTPVEPGEQIVRVNVSIKYRLGAPR